MADADWGQGDPFVGGSAGAPEAPTPEAPAQTQPHPWSDEEIARWARTRPEAWALTQSQEAAKPFDYRPADTSGVTGRLGLAGGRVMNALQGLWKGTGNPAQDPIYDIYEQAKDMVHVLPARVKKMAQDYWLTGELDPAPAVDAALLTMGATPFGVKPGAGPALGAGPVERSTAASAMSISQLMDRWTDRGVRNFIADRPARNEIQLSDLVVPKDQRGQGIGSEFMNDLVDHADANGKTITLTASKDYGSTSIARLKEFYKQFGFVENKGRNKDFTISDNMYRKPKPQLPMDEAARAARMQEQHYTIDAYHGTQTPHVIDEFQTGPVYDEQGNMIHTSSSDPNALLGPHFSKETSVANKFAMGKGTGGSQWLNARYTEGPPAVYPVKLNARNVHKATETEINDHIYQQSANTQAVDDVLDRHARDSGDADIDRVAKRYEEDADYRAEVNREAIMEEVRYDEPSYDTAHELASAARADYQKRGVTTIEYPNDIEGGTSYIAIAPPRSRFARFDPANEGQGTILGAGSTDERLAPAFYSAVHEAVNAAKTERAPAQQWLGTLRNTPGVKPEELDWLGVEDWLKQQQGPVSKQDLADYMRANQVELKEVNKGEPPNVPNITNDENGFLAYARRQRERGRALTPEEALQEDHILERSRIYQNALDKAEQQGGTKFSQWQLPGGENYREMLLTMPRRQTEAPSQFRSRREMGQWLREKYGNEGDNYINNATPEEQAQFWALPGGLRADAQALPAQDWGGDFRGSHWDEPNVIAHTRFNDRTIDGKKTLFLEEIQSDWHQKGRTQGYQSNKFALKEPTGETFEVYPTRSAAEAEMQPGMTIHEVPGTGVPDAPFKTSWPELALKRMIKYAADNGYEKIAWTPGDVQAARYDLSKQISKLSYQDGALVAHDLRGKEVMREHVEPTAEAMEEFIGKEPAKKLEDVVKQHEARQEYDRQQWEPYQDEETGKWHISDPNGEAMYEYGGELATFKNKRQADEHIDYMLKEELERTPSDEAHPTISGLDLKVGGEGMAGFYDKILPAAANKIGKKYGARVERGELGKPAPLSEIGQVKPQDGGGWKIEWEDGTFSGGYGSRHNAETALRLRSDKIKTQNAEPAQRVHTMDITPDLRDTAKQKGFTLFSGLGDRRAGALALGAASLDPRVGLALWQHTLDPRSGLVHVEHNPFGLGDPFALTDNPGLVSPRAPSVSGTEGHLTHYLPIDLNALRMRPDVFEHAVDLLRRPVEYTNEKGTRREAYLNLRPDEAAGSHEQVLENYVNQMHQNLLALYNHPNVADWRDRATHWYPGGHDIIQGWSRENGLPPVVNSAVIARLSPGRRWDMNVDLARRMIENWRTKQNEPWSTGMADVLDRLPLSPKSRTVYEEVRGRSYRELETPKQKAIWLRLYDQANHPQGFRLVTPEGQFGRNVQGPNGDFPVQWPGLSDLSRVIPILESGGDMSVISNNLGDAHKIRVFHNTLMHPNSPLNGAVIDTHAVAAALLRPLSQTSLEVVHNFGSSPEVPGLRVTKGAAPIGVSGTYPIYDEAYRRAAATEGVLPRQMQSVTWEALRTMFPAVFKRQQANVAKINKIWEDYRSGKASVNATRAKIFSETGGPKEPDWNKADSGAVYEDDE